MGIFGTESEDVTSSRSWCVLGHAGLVDHGQLAEHWAVHRDSVPRIAATLGLRETRLRARPSYRWSDVWAAEGAGAVPERDWPDHRAPLLTPGDLARLLGVAPRTVRGYLADGRLPVIRLTSRLRRVRPCALEARLYEADPTGREPNGGATAGAAAG